MRFIRVHGRIVPIKSGADFVAGAKGAAQKTMRAPIGKAVTSLRPMKEAFKARDLAIARISPTSKYKLGAVGAALAVSAAAAGVAYVYGNRKNRK